MYKVNRNFVILNWLENSESVIFCHAELDSASINVNMPLVGRIDIDRFRVKPGMTTSLQHSPAPNTFTLSE